MKESRAVYEGRTEREARFCVGDAICINESIASRYRYRNGRIGAVTLSRHSRTLDKYQVAFVDGETSTFWDIQYSRTAPTLLDNCCTRGARAFPLICCRNGTRLPLNSHEKCVLAGFADVYATVQIRA